MAHTHSIYDTDPHFSIDAKTRVISNLSGDKWTLIQYDHNSERITFELPRYIDSHDMTLCNQVQVHYINIGENGERTAGIYEVTDLDVSPDSDDVVICSWLISRNATSLVGSLSFIVRFSCVTDSMVDYSWNTAIYNNIAISNGINNSEIIIEEYADILAQWSQELEQLGVTVANKADKDADAVPGNLAIFDAEGNPVDGGTTPRALDQVFVATYDPSNQKDGGITSFEELRDAYYSGKILLFELPDAGESDLYLLSNAAPAAFFRFACCWRYSSGRELTKFATCRRSGSDTIWEFSDGGDPITPASIGAASATELATVKKQNRVFYGTCDTLESTKLDVYLNAESKERWDSVKNGDMLICRMTQYSVENPELAVYLTSGWTEHMRTACNYNKATGSANSIQAKHWRGGSVIVFVYDETFGGWLAQNLQAASTSYYGLIKLDDSVSSSSTTTAATANAVRQVQSEVNEVWLDAREAQQKSALFAAMIADLGVVWDSYILFRCNEDCFAVKPNMTWQEFVNSNYNVVHHEHHAYKRFELSVDDDGVFYLAKVEYAGSSWHPFYCRIRKSNGEYVKLSDTIGSYYYVAED